MTTSAASSYRERVGAALAGGSRFAGLHATSGGTLVRTLLADPDGATRLETVTAANFEKCNMVSSLFVNAG